MSNRKMKIVSKAALISLLLISIFPQTLTAQEVWQAQNSGIDDTDLRAISVFAEDANFVCAASAQSVYFSENGGKFWQKVFSFATEEGQINFVTFDSANPKIIYLATSKGLFVTQDQGRNWQRVFRKVKEEAKEVTWVSLDARNHQKIYLGTKEGLYVSYDLRTNWRKSSTGLARCQVRSIAVHPANSHVLYLANNYGLYKSIDSAQSWERVYVTSDKVIEEEDEEEYSELESNQSLINCIAIDKAEPKNIFIATGQGVFLSRDAGYSWNKLPAQGLNSDYVNFIVVDEEQAALYAATKKGVFKFPLAGSNFNSWQKIYQGMIASDVRSLALDRQEKQLFAATERGVLRTVNAAFWSKAESETVDCEQLLKELSQNEPTIQQVQQAALRYAEVVHPEKIKALRRDAKLKALLPDVSVDYDKTINYDSGADRYYVGPYDWGFTFSWDVGDLVYSEQVRLIDSNARLLVQLRDDILNEVTRLYYERRRLQSEFILTPPESLEEELSRTLRLEELTANIDALTGGYFSQAVSKKKLD